MQRLHAGIRSALASQDVIDGLAAAYMEPMPTSSAELGRLLKTETEFWANLVKTVGFSPE